MTRARLCLVGLACAALDARAEEPPAPEAPPPLEIRTCTRTPSAFPNGLPAALEAAVEIRTSSALGTGFVVSPDGFILTAAHVVTGQSEVDVRIGALAPKKATVLRVDTQRDVAVLYVAGTTYPCMPLSMETATQGTDLWVIGAPRGDESFSVMRGIVSATRTVNQVRLLQTDAAVNPGDSGGAMLDGTGRVRAIVSFKVSGTGFEGIGFGVPVHAATEALDLTFGARSTPDPQPVGVSVAAATGGLGASGPASTPPTARSSGRESRWETYLRARAKKRRTAFITTTAVGSGLTVGGGAMYLATLTKYLKVRHLDADDPAAIDRSQWARMQAVNGVGVGLFAVGAIATTVGAVGWRHSQPRSVSASIAPAPGGFVLVGAF